jgi:hypothetical protein
MIPPTTKEKLYMSLKNSKGTKNSLTSIGLLLFDLPATEIPLAEFNTWCGDHMLKHEVGLLSDGIVIVGSLNPPGFTMWKGLII